MRIQNIDNVQILGISATVPKQIHTNPVNKSTNLTGVYQRRVADSGICTSDLCYTSANALLTELNIDRSDIDVVIFVSQTADYKLPITSAILQDKLGLPQSCICFDIPLGCSGYVYGLYIISSLMSKGAYKKGILLAGDTISKEVNVNDGSTYPLFGDAGTATILAYDNEAAPIKFNLGTDGSGFESIIQPDGGSRNGVTANSFVEETDQVGNTRTPLQIKLNGADVYNFGTDKVSSILIDFCKEIEIEPLQVDHLVLHQANKFMNDRIVKKAGFQQSQALTSLEHFGNTSSATIPLTMLTNLQNTPQAGSLLLCGFGVGLSWATAYIERSDIYYTNLLEI